MSTGPELSDAELMSRIQAGDQLAFKHLYLRHHSRIYGYLLRMLRDETRAEDLRQDTFVRLWEARARWSGRGSVVGYLVQIARNLALNLHRRDQVHERWSRFAASEQTAYTTDPDHWLQEKELRAQVIAAVQNLPERQREVISLRRDAGLSNREIAELLDISQKTVEAHLTKAFRLLRESLSSLRD